MKCRTFFGILWNALLHRLPVTFIPGDPQGVHLEDAMITRAGWSPDRWKACRSSWHSGPGRRSGRLPWAWESSCQRMPGRGGPPTAGTSSAPPGWSAIASASTPWTCSTGTSSPPGGTRTVTASASTPWTCSTDVSSPPAVGHGQHQHHEHAAQGHHHHLVGVSINVMNMYGNGCIQTLLTEHDKATPNHLSYGTLWGKTQPPVLWNFARPHPTTCLMELCKATPNHPSYRAVWGNTQLPVLWNFVRQHPANCLMELCKATPSQLSYKPL